MADFVLSQPYYQGARLRPSRGSPSTNVPARGSLYGELFTQSLNRRSLTDEGSFFIATSPTPGTGIAGHAAPTTVDDTKPFLLLKNNYTATDGRQLYLEWVLIQCTAAGTGGSNIRWAAKTDAAGVNRYTSGGSAITPINPNNASSETPTVTMVAGAVIAPAASANARLIQSHLFRSVINVVGDTYLIRFGSEAPTLNGVVINGTNPAQVEVDFPQVILDPQATFLLHQASASQSAAASYEFAACFSAR